MAIKLTIYDRISIPVMFPEKSSFADAIVYDDIRNKIKITQEEVVSYNIRNTKDGSGIEWDEEKEGGKDFEFSGAEMRLLEKTFKELDTKAQVPTDPKFIQLYKKFMH
jgi:hypothetical protein